MGLAYRVAAAPPEFNTFLPSFLVANLTVSGILIRGETIIFRIPFFMPKGDRQR
jgi:hypothetical protein